MTEDEIQAAMAPLIENARRAAQAAIGDTSTKADVAEDDGVVQVGSLWAVWGEDEVEFGAASVEFFERAFTTKSAAEAHAAGIARGEVRPLPVYGPATYIV